MTAIVGAVDQWPCPWHEVDPLEINEAAFIDQGIAEALRAGADCDIEQMVRWRSGAAVRRRVRVRLERDGEDSIVGLHVAFERDGDPVAEWALARQAASQQGGETDLALAGSEAVNAFSAVLLHAEAIRQHLKRDQTSDIARSVEHILANAHRAWRHVRALCRVQLPAGQGALR